MTTGEGEGRDAATDLTEDDVVQLFRESGALLEGHFLLSSGLHSGHYLQCARVLMDPGRAARLCAALITRLQRGLDGREFDAVVAPAMGGIILGYELARQSGAASLFVERVDGAFTLRRGFTLAPGTTVLIAEDVVTTGLSSRECIACVAAEGAEVIGLACLVDRSCGTAEVGVPLVTLASLDLPVFRADQLPPELVALPATKPGSRPRPGRSDEVARPA